jgi:hypothetical protein
VTIELAGRAVAVRRVALRPKEVAEVAGETEQDILLRLRCGDLASVVGTGDWLVHVESAAALVQGKVDLGLLDAHALDTLAGLVRQDRIRR